MKFPRIGRGENDEGSRDPAGESEQPVESGAHADVPAAQPTSPGADPVSEPVGDARAEIGPSAPTRRPRKARRSRCPLK